MQWSLDVRLPELDELEQLGVIWRQIVVLPDKDIEHVPVVWHPVEELGGGEAVALEHQLGLRHFLILSV